MLKAIQRIAPDIPVIIMTGHANVDAAIEAVRHGAFDFIKKPFEINYLLNAVKKAVERGKLREQELLKYREKSNIIQQEKAFKKELNIIRDDLFLKKVDVANNRGMVCEWIFDIHYKPLEIMNGDTYSIRKIDGGKVLVYIASAMGKGPAASVTSVISTSLVNHLVNEATEGTTFDFREFIVAYSKSIRKELVEEEIFCVTFLFLDLVNETMEAVLCAMPPVLCHAADDNIMRIESNNPPFTLYPGEISICQYDLKDTHKILAYTSGLNKSFVNKDTIYTEYLENDFRHAEFKKDLLAKFNNAVKNPDDDVTFIFVRKMHRKPKWTRVLTIGSRMDEVTAVALEVEGLLEALDASAEFKVLFINGFSEIIMNAYEHGSLNIDSELKGRLVQDDTYNDYLMKTERDITKTITIVLALQELNGNDYLMLTVTDQGNGFDTSILRALECDYLNLNGRGIQMTTSFTDELFYNTICNEVTLLKKIVRG